MVRNVRSRRLAPGARYQLTTPLARFPLTLRAQTSDKNVFRQVFIEREYRCLDDVRDPELVIDCGANVGFSAAYMLSRFPNARVIAIEPDPANYAMLVENTKPYGTRCSTIESGVWSSAVPLVVESAPEGAGREWSVTVRPAEEGEAASLTAVDVTTALRMSGASRISILKVDIEGSEAEVFARNTEPWIDLVDTMVIEIHNERCHEIVMAAVGGQGFEVSQCDELTVFRRRAAGP